MKIAIFAIFLMISTINSQCSTGCLKCSSNQQTCLFCDPFSQFALTNNTCTQVNVPNCALIRSDGRCISCNQGFYLDNLTLNCFTIPTHFLISNCTNYYGNFDCQVCSPGNFLFQNLCYPSTNITSCMMYETVNICSQCQPGFINSLDRTKCTATNSTVNCMTYSNIDCLSCNPGYIRNKNYYLYKMFQDVLPDQVIWLTLKYQESITNFIDGYKVPVCQPIIAQNCATFVTFNSCGQCNPGFYLNTAQNCIANPLAGISNCSSYQAANICLGCIDGFFLSSPQQCSSIISVQNCSVYAPVAITTTCNQCITGFFLRGINNCTQRTSLSNISNCQILNPLAENCSNCVNRFQLTNDSAACLPVLPFCQLYEPSSQGSTILVCNTCIPGYFYNTSTTLCVSGTVANCSVYNRTTMDCVTCANKYYLEQGTCLRHYELSHCSTYSNTVANSCSSCSNASFLFNTGFNCIPVNIISQCVVYSTVSTCLICKDGFMINSNFTCDRIPSIQNCLQMQNGLCTKCISLFVLQTGLCVAPNDYITLNCANHNVNGTNNYTSIGCSTCKEFSIPINYINSFVCVENAFMINLRSASLDLNCLQYIPQNAVNTFVCAKCEVGLFLFNGNCITTIPTTNTAYTTLMNYMNINSATMNDSFQVVSSWVIGPLITNCDIAAPSLTITTNVNNPTYNCVQCKSGFIPKIIPNATVAFTKYSFLPTFQSQTRFSGRDLRANLNTTLYTGPVSFNPAVVCMNPLTEPMMGDLNTTPGVTSCEFYADLGLGTGCIKCDRGHTGIVVNQIWNCVEYLTMITCGKCKQGFFPITPTSCVRVSQIANCIQYSSNVAATVCIQCGHQFFIQNNACSPRVFTLFEEKCSVLSLTQDICTTCNINFYWEISLNRCIQSARQCAQNQFIQATLTVTCLSCNNFFYLKNGECFHGEITNCMNYVINPIAPIVPGDCLVCNEGFYLINKVCLPHNSMPNCASFSQTNANVCLRCVSNFYLFKISKVCKSTFAVENCAIQTEEFKCDTCNPGYYPDSANSICFPISTIDNCITYSNQIKSTPAVRGCILCRPGFLLQTSSGIQVCRMQYQLLATNCDTLNGGITSLGNETTRSCKYCASGSDDVDLSQEGICIENIYLNSFNNNSPPLANCIRYQTAGTSTAITYICLECAANFVLSGDTPAATVCIAANTCPSTKYIIPYALTIATNNVVTITKMATCTNTVVTPVFIASAPLYTLDHCAQISINSYSTLTTASTIEYGCTVCQTGFIAATNLANNFGVISRDHTTVSSPLNFFPAITCVAKPLLTEMKGSSFLNLNGLISDCEIYLTNATPTYGCLRCKWGFTGPINNVMKTINSCFAIQNCNTNAKLAGLVPGYTEAITNIAILPKVISCLQCNDPILIPTLFADFTSTYIGFQNYAQFPRFFNSTLPINSTSGWAMECLNRTTLNTDLNINSIYASNCSVLAGNTAVPRSPTSPTDSTGSSATSAVMVCIACNPGFIATRSTASSALSLITACTAIANCSSSTWLNACSQCAVGFAYKANGLDIRYDICTAVTDLNCNVWDIGTNSCRYCNRGFTLLNGLCSAIFSPLCATNQRFTSMSFNKIDLPTIYYLNGKLPGCQQCTTTTTTTPSTITPSTTTIISYTPVTDTTYLYKQSISVSGLLTVLDVARNVCITRNIVNLINPTSSIANCVTAQFRKNLLTSTLSQNAFDCIQCSANWVIANDGGCANGIFHQNCVRARTSQANYCDVCSTGSLNVAGVCLSINTTTPLIQNCVTYDVPNSKNNVYALCLTCALGFYSLNQASLNSNTCVPIPSNSTLANCANYGVVTTQNSIPPCISCLTGFSLLTNIGMPYVSTAPLPSSLIQMCINTTSTVGFNCQAWNPDSFSTSNLACDSCNTSNLLVNQSGLNITIPIDLTNPTSFCLPISPIPNCASYQTQTTNTLEQSPFYQLNQTNNLTCTNCNTGFFLNITSNTCQNRTIIANCNVYEITFDRCNTCAPNFFITQTKDLCNPAPVLANSPALLPGFIISCRPITDCTNVFFDGLDVVVASYASCHQCKTLGNIPYIVIRGTFPYQSIQGVNQYNLNAGATSGNFDKGQSGTSVICINPNQATLGLTTTTIAAANCGIGLLNANAGNSSSDSSKASGVSRSNIATFCGACLPGFKATIATTANPITGLPEIKLPNVITACTQISNCEGQEWFNFCSRCQLNYSYGYNLTTGVQYDFCGSLKTNPDCFAADFVTNPAIPNCKYCKPGTYRNLDGYCERINPPRCQFGQFNFRFTYPIGEMFTGNFLEQRATGCNRCQSGYIGVFMPNKTMSCTQSIIHARKQLPSNTLYISNCQIYLVPNDGILRCSQCYATFIPTLDTGLCIPTSTLPNCLVAATFKYCQTCVNNFVLVNRICVATNITSCRTYFYDDKSTQQLCSVCQPGWFLNNNVCFLGNVPNCFTYVTQFTCSVCLPGYQLSQSQGGMSYCFPIDVSTNCATFNQTDFQNGLLNCITCVSNRFIPTINNLNIYPTMCMRLTSITNCLTYNVQSSMAKSSLGCTLCINGFFVSNLQCAQRVKIVFRCVTYDPNNDACLTCTTGFFPDQTGSICLPNPLGVIGCTNYNLVNSLPVCTACGEAMYLLNGNCITVPAANIITNCVIYLNINTCTSCLQNFAVSNSVCVNSIATGCVTYVNPNSCSTCPPNFGLQTDSNGNINCVQKQTQNCINSANSFPFACITCNSNFYPLNGTCTAVSNLISNCEVYGQNVTCTKCASGFAISANSTSCDGSLVTSRSIDPFCSSSATVSPICVVCAPGYYFGMINSTNTVASPNISTNTTETATPIITTNTTVNTTTNTTSVTNSTSNTSTATASNTTAATNTTSNTTTNTTTTTVPTTTPTTSTNVTTASAILNPTTVGNMGCIRCPDINCMACNPANPDTCFMCKIGFFQPGIGACTPNVPVQNSSNQTNVAQNTSSNTTGVDILSTMLLILQLAVLFFI